jgi:hypothetical protein
MNVSRHGAAWLALALIAAAPVRAQEDACRRQSLMASVMDAKGNPVPGLGRADFSARFRGKPVNITFAELDTHTRRIVILLDASGSMLADHWKPALDAADDLLTKVPVRIPIALAVFSDKVEKKVGFSQGRAAIEAELAALRARHKAMLKSEPHTALWDSVLDALGMFGTPHLGDVIYAITDGEDNKSKYDYGKVEQVLASSGIRLFALLPLRGNLPLTVEELTGPQDLREAVAVTGGLLVSFGRIISPLQLSTKRDSSALPQPALDALYREMAVFYRLDVELPEAVDKPRDWDLKLEAPGKNKKGWNLVYPRKLMPCAPAAR